MPTVMLEPTAAERALRHHGIPALQRIVVEQTDSTLVLTGSVPSYYLKQLAQESVRPLLAGRRLVNRIEVSSR